MAVTPRHSRKEVRQLAQWLVDELGAVHDDFDTNGHAIYRFPNGNTIKLPETPKGHTWLARTRAEAMKAAGHKVTGKYDAAAARKRDADRRALAKAAAQRHLERLAVEKARRNRERLTREQLMHEEDDFNRYASLMGGGGYRRPAVG
jgi:hypothetical protein